ncbi:type VI secretion protein ImpA [Dryocola sp. BD626]|uniref:type VI secretion protein ImpA n=1 Tax=Dryocola sp. BD626 TaxID=3133273 RepID=UPI003F503B32
MAVLHPQECYLLEKFISAEHYAETRDAIIAYIDAHEAALARFKKDMPLNIRSRPLPQQADIVWENRVMPNLRPMKDRYMQAYILRTHEDIKAFNIGHAMSNIRKGIVEFWNGWMTDEEIEKISALESAASELDMRLSTTLDATWNEGELTYCGVPGIYTLEDIPSQIPRYVLDPSIRIENGDNPVQTGFYLPDIYFAPARFIPADFGEPPETWLGVKRSDYVSKEGKRNFSWKESEWAKTGWTLIRRVEGEFIDVPREGFFPAGKPEELYSWPQREQDRQQEKMVRITRWTDEIAPHAGQWATIVNGTTEYIQTREGQKMPTFVDKYGKQHRACWKLLKRDDKGSVFVPPENNN